MMNPQASTVRGRSYAHYLLGCLFLLGLGVFLALGAIFLFVDDTSPRVYNIHLSDMNGDKSLDAFLVFLNGTHKINLNNGAGHFALAGELMMYNYVLALGDLNGDGGLDAVINTTDNGEMHLACTKVPDYFVFEPPVQEGTPQTFSASTWKPGGSPMVFIAGCCVCTSVLHSYGIFSKGAPCLSEERTNAVTLTDLNGDGSLDAFLAKGWRYLDGQRNTPNEIWFNDGQGNFTDSGQRLGNAESFAVALGDVNGDGFPDAVVGNHGQTKSGSTTGRGTSPTADSGLAMALHIPCFYWT